MPLCSVRLKLSFACSVAMAFASRALIGSMSRPRFDAQGAEESCVLLAMSLVYCSICRPITTPNSHMLD